MTGLRRAAKRDENEPEMVAELRKTHMVSHLSGSGVPDLLVIKPAPDVPVFVCETVEQARDIANLDEPIVLIEVKGKGKKLRPQQVKWHNEARGIVE